MTPPHPRLSVALLDHIIKGLGFFLGGGASFKISFSESFHEFTKNVFGTTLNM